MKLLFISIYKSCKKSKDMGVVKKIDLQKKQFKKAGIDVKLVDYMHSMRFLAGVPIAATGKCEKISGLSRYDAIYIRFLYGASWDLIKFIRKYKKQRPDGKVLLEIPTYPYKDEMCSQCSRIYYYTTQIGLFLLHFYLDRFVLISSGLPSVMNIPVINIRNFIDYDATAVRIANDSRDVINVICVASFNVWHGYDRLIEGLKDYLCLPDHERVVLHMVGDLKKVRRLGLIRAAERYNLQQNIIFYGVLTGEKLDAVYDKCDLACNSFGMHRIGFSVSASLKAREYAAKGLPMLVSSELDVENADTEQYICHFPSDESPIDFVKLVQFYHKVYDGKGKQSVADEIRRSFEKYCSVDECFKDVVQYVIGVES